MSDVVDQVNRLTASLHRRLMSAARQGALIDVEFERHEVTLIEAVDGMESRKPLWTMVIRVAEPVPALRDLKPPQP